jgi:hypothetical protein
MIMLAMPKIAFFGGSDRTLWIKDIHRRTRKWNR